MGELGATAKWSDRLEQLAEGMFCAWQEETRAAGDPFRKICVVVNDTGTRDWLKQYYLVARKRPGVLLNISFVMLAEFVNDWLFAQTHGSSLESRRASLHPYAKDVLAWRIDGILEECPGDFPELSAYIGSQEQTMGRRRHALSEQLAQLYDDYLNSRYGMLARWEKGDRSQDRGVPGWQLELYRRLVFQNPGTYVRDYGEALAADADPRQSLLRGFPDYLSIHLFDIPFFSEPTLELVEKISQGFPLHYWCYTPQMDWLGETPAKTEARRALAAAVRSQREALRDGRHVELDELMEGSYENAGERLLGALASGVRGVLGAFVDRGLLDYEAREEFPEGAPADFPTLSNLESVTVHVNYSPRRELEAMKDGLLDFFRRHPDARPHDALVLCGNWDDYAPIVESVFGGTPGQEGYLPVTMGGGISGETPLIQSYQELLEFRRNRFEAGAVLELLTVPAIRAGAGLSEEDMERVRDMVGKANIRWGLDDQDVAETLGVAVPQEPYPFTWQRGLDRMAADMLYGETSEDGLVNLGGALGEILLCGNVEGDRSRILGALWAFVDRLGKLRRDFAAGIRRTGGEWSRILLEVIGDFYAESDENAAELKRIRLAVRNGAECVCAAGRGDDLLEGQVYLDGVLSSIRNTLPGSRTPADAVLFTSLKNSTATPHRLVWICGLNEGKFPRNEFRPAYDVIGRHPSLFDVSTREKDAYAFLKAALGARQELCLSYVGRNIRTNESIPPSVLLEDLLDYFREQPSGRRYRQVVHPLQPYSRKYFQEGTGLPQSYSQENQRVAEALVASGGSSATGDFIAAFDFAEEGAVTELSLDELLEFYTRPSHYLAGTRLEEKILWLSRQNDQEALVAALGNSFLSRVILGEEFTEEKCRREARIFVESGGAPDFMTAYNAIQEKANTDCSANQNRPLAFSKENSGFTCKDLSIVEAYKKYLSDSVCRQGRVGLQALGRPVELLFDLRTVSLDAQGGPCDFVCRMEKSTVIYESTFAAAWLSHLAGHAAGLRFMTLLLCQKDGPARAFPPLEAEEAKGLLEKWVTKALEPLPEEYLAPEALSGQTKELPFFWAELSAEKDAHRISTSTWRRK